MPKYLVHGSYTEQGLKGLLKEGGSKRREAVARMTKGLGGKVDAFYFGFGADDFFIVIDGPDNVGVAAAVLAAGASGTVRAKTTVLLTPEEIDEAVKRTVSFRPAGN